MAGQTILVTGSTDGIGRAAARILAGQGHRVLLHGRSREKGRRVLDELEEETGSDRLSLFIADLAVQEQVRALAGEIGDAYGRLDVLVNNAGVFMPERKTASDGIEMTFAVNYLGGFLLTHELLPLLSASAPARIVNVASITHRSVQAPDLANLPGFENYDGYKAYAVSKLGVVAFTARLARILEGTGVTANCLHPGAIDTKLLRAYWGERGGGAPPERGAKVVVHLVVSPEAGRMNGRYFEETRWTSPSALALAPEIQEQFWGMGLKLTSSEEWRLRGKAYAG
ncbi:SDR family NAD(P)-dependent oxidoreductase [Methanoculleus sp. Wushi-C6]|uniref:SDR family NAD(P)-dependent oxidoreductase n=1 Tax=Methanoculleus caldifontis TaxID=2651577 RepID=A0ABU3X395_9EURY|nr:SDR family NAD(P)-dependent oxidoreductase [Methanoculleus sp. Wushi-C6]MDV2482538.1 SDR family NAD(P)-dependent oxidoreductase [Methanoculleus sp. Wushi-C6]